MAMFVFLTRNVESNKDTWDVVNWEISAAYTKRKSIYVFAQKGVSVPLMVKYITVYAHYDPLSQQSLNEMANKVQGIAHAYKESGDKAKAAFGIVALFLGLIFLGSLLGGD